MTDGKTEAARITTGAGMLAASGLTLNDWVLVATIIYFFVQTLILIPKLLGVIADFQAWLDRRRAARLAIPLDIDSTFLPEEKQSIFKRILEKIKNAFKSAKANIKKLFGKLCSHDENNE
jgi:hypothetical protein